MHPTNKNLLPVLVDTLAERLKDYCLRVRQGPKTTRNLLTDHVSHSYHGAATVVWGVLLSHLGKPRSHAVNKIGTSLNDEGMARWVQRKYPWKYRQLQAVYTSGVFRGILRNFPDAPSLTLKERATLGLVCYELALLGGGITEKKIKKGKRWVRHTFASPGLEQFISEAPPGTPVASPEPLSAVPCGDVDTPVGIPGDAAATLREQPYTLSHEVLAVAEELYRLGSPLFPPKDPIPLPEKGEFSELSEWKRRAHWIHDQNRRMVSRRLSYLTTFQGLRAAAALPEFYMDVFPDRRGRCYYRPTFTSVQGSDLSQGCALFKYKGEIHEEARQRYAEALLPGFDEGFRREVAADPVGSRGLWEGSKKPWPLLQLCLHWDNPGLPVSVDASNHGLQLMSILCNQGMELTKVKATDIPPEDIYLRIGNAVQPGLPRDLWKHPIMTLPYGASKLSWVWKFFAEEDPESPGKYRFLLSECWDLATRLEQEVRSQLPWAMDLFKFLRAIGGKAKAPLTWTVPAGYNVTQFYPKLSDYKIRTRLFGTAKSSVYSTPTDEPSGRKNGKGLTPNLIQSLDASLLHSALRGWGGPIATAHDRFATTSDHLPTLYAKLLSNVDEQLCREGLLRDLLSGFAPDTEIPFDIPEWETWTVSPLFYNF